MWIYRSKGTRNDISMTRILRENMIMVQKKMYVCFANYQKTFCRVRHIQQIDMLIRIRIDGRDVSLIGDPISEIRSNSENKRGPIRLSESRRN